MSQQLIAQNCNSVDSCKICANVAPGVFVGSVERTKRERSISNSPSHVAWTLKSSSFSHRQPCVALYIARGNKLDAGSQSTCLLFSCWDYLCARRILKIS
jgi:hypothetical protein